MEHAVLRVRPFAGHVEATLLAIEARPPRRDLADALRPFLDQDPGRGLGHDPRSGLEGVHEVQGRGVVLAERHRHPALGVARIALGRLVLRDHQHLPVVGQAKGRPQPRDAGAEDQEVGTERLGGHGLPWAALPKPRILAEKAGRPRLVGQLRSTLMEPCPIAGGPVGPLERACVLRGDDESPDVTFRTIAGTSTKGNDLTAGAGACYLSVGLADRRPASSP